ncbi:hypothetical protein D3C84_259380 [compost metagenome]
MALNTGLGFARFAEREHCLIELIATTPPEPTAHELRSIRKAEKRKRRELSALKESDFFFDFTPAAPSSDLEQQMREALFTNSPVKPKEPELLLASFEFVPSIAKSAPTPGIEQASETAKLHAKLEKEISASLRIPAPKKTPLKRKDPLPTSRFKRRLEVMLLVRDLEWYEIPFIHVEYDMTAVEAEIAAGKKARSFGLVVRKLISVKSEEIEVTRVAG